SLARQPRHRPEQPHRRHAVVTAAHRRLTRDIDATVLVANESRLGLPARPAREGFGRSQAYGPARWKASELDRDRRIDRNGGLVDDNRCGHGSPSAHDPWPSVASAALPMP